MENQTYNSLANSAALLSRIPAPASAGKGDLRELEAELVRGVRSQGGAQPLPQAVIVVDPFSTGACLAEKACALGYVCIRVLSDEYPDKLLDSVVPEGCRAKYTETVQHRPSQGVEVSMRETLATLRSLPYDFVGCMPGCETGVEVSDLIASELGLYGNDPAMSYCRRNKYDMGEALRSAGVRAVKQCRASSWAEAADFTANLRESLDARGLPFKCVVKPTRSAGSDGVTFCSSEEEVRVAVETLVKTENIFGEANGEVVCQEYLSGQEYVVDTVSCAGVSLMAKRVERTKREREREMRWP